MPRVKSLTQEQRAKDAFYNFIKVQCVVRNITQSDIASLFGISQPAVAYKLKHRTLTISEFVDVIGLFDMSVTEALSMIDVK